MKIIQFLKPTTLFGKIGLALYLGGAISFFVGLIYFSKYPTGNLFTEMAINLTTWLLGVVGLIMYLIYLVKKNKK